MCPFSQPFPIEKTRSEIENQTKDDKDGKNTSFNSTRAFVFASFAKGGRDQYEYAHIYVLVYMCHFLPERFRNESISSRSTNHRLSFFAKSCFSWKKKMIHMRKWSRKTSRKISIAGKQFSHNLFLRTSEQKRLLIDRGAILPPARIIWKSFDSFPSLIFS